MFQKPISLSTYQSKEFTISKSAQHQDMWIVTNNDTGKFHMIAASESVILAIHPKD